MPVNRTELRSNNFDFLRLVAALMVIYGHSAALLKLPPLGCIGAPISTVGVMIFFSVSGYLVTKSWQLNPHLQDYLLKRALRIFPALVACVLLTALVVGPIATTLPILDYFHAHTFKQYFLNCILKIRYFLPGVFEHNTYSGAVNGSLWTLPVEFFCYLVIAAMGLGHKAIRPWLSFGVLLVIFGAAYYSRFFWNGDRIIFYDTSINQSLHVIPFFFAGSLFCILQDRVKCRLDVSILAIFALYYAQANNLDHTLICLSWFAVPYISIAFGSAATPILSRAGRWGDFSYGIYLYGFIVQQSIIGFYANQVSFWTLMMASTIIATVLAIASWHLIEKRALALKHRWLNATYGPMSTSRATSSRSDIVVAEYVTSKA